MNNMANRQYSGFATFPLDKAALGLLVVSPKHGYELYRDFVEAFGLIWRAGRSKFYATLSALQGDGCLDVTTEPQEDRPPRKVYQLTDAGRDVFTHWLYQPVRPLRSVRVELLAKLRFFDILGLPDADRLIDAQIATCQAELDHLSQQRSRRLETGEDLFCELVYDFRQRQTRFIVEWLDTCKGYFQ